MASPLSPVSVLEYAPICDWVVESEVEVGGLTTVPIFAHNAYTVPSRSIGISDLPFSSNERTLLASASLRTVLQPWNS